jgi:hypothetical protein
LAIVAEGEDTNRPVSVTLENEWYLPVEAIAIKDSQDAARKHSSVGNRSQWRHWSEQAKEMAAQLLKAPKSLEKAMAMMI